MCSAHVCSTVQFSFLLLYPTSFCWVCGSSDTLWQASRFPGMPSPGGEKQPEGSETPAPHSKPSDVCHRPSQPGSLCMKTWDVGWAVGRESLGQSKPEGDRGVPAHPWDRWLCSALRRGQDAHVRLVTHARLIFHTLTPQSSHQH